MTIAVAGTGYVGLVTGVCMAEKGHSVICVDVNEEKVKLMQQGISPIYEPGLDELLTKNRERLEFTTDYAKAYSQAEVIFIGVATPERRDGSADLSYVFTVADNIAKTIERDCVIVVKSTVPIGTNDRIEDYIRRNLAHPVAVHVASNPEFLAQGTAVVDTLHAARIVIGVEERYPEDVLREVYAGYDAPVLVTNRRSAEMIKYASNDFLALKISYINEIANLCEHLGANVEHVSKGMGYDDRIGKKFLEAGIGYGGSCFPKDTKALNSLATINGIELKTIAAAIDVNERQKMRLLEKAQKYYEDYAGLTVAVLGLTFKPGTDDLREAPSLVNIPILLEYGANIKAWDPVGVPNFKKKHPHDIQYCETIEETIENADICFIFTEWPEVVNLAPEAYKNRMAKPIILDGRNCYSLDVFRGLGVVYESIGRECVN